MIQKSDSNRERRKCLPSIRLVMAGGLSLVLILWIGFSNDAIFAFRYGDALFGWVTASVSVFILTTLFPVARYGSKTDRWLAGLLAIFPIVVLAAYAVLPFFWVPRFRT